MLTTWPMWRTFVRSSRYAAVPDATLLRRADGTGFAVLPASGPSGAGSFEAGEYRLELTYRRDNTGTDPESQIFRESGDSTPEATQIDFTLS